MIINRYLSSQIFKITITMLGILVILIIFNRFSFYLGSVSVGKIPANMIFPLIFLRLPELLGVIIPLTLVISILVIHERLYSSNELIALYTAGFSRQQLFVSFLKPTMLFFIVLCFSVFVLGPASIGEINRQIEKKKKQQEQLFPLKTFFTLDDGRTNVFIHGFDTQEKLFNKVFISNVSPDDEPSFLVAQKAYVEQRHNRTYLVLKDGVKSVDNKKQQVQLIKFKLLGQDITDYWQISSFYQEERTLNIWQLYKKLNSNESNQAVIAQFGWLLSIPVMMLLLVFIAFTFCDVEPRKQHRFTSIGVMFTLFIVYYLLMDSCKDNVEIGNFSGVIFILLHGCFAIFGLLLANKQRLFLRWKQLRVSG